MNGSIFRKHGDKLLFCLALIVLAAAMFRLENKTAAKANVPAPIIVFTQWWQDDLEKNALMDIIEEFESLHEGIKVVFNTMPYEDLRKTLFNFAGDESAEKEFPGDIIALDPLWIPELVKGGIMERPSAGELLSFINVLYYNIEMLKEAGFSRPPKSRGEFVSYARALGKKEGRPDAVLGMALGRDSSRGIYDDVLPWIWAAGAVLARDGKPELGSRQVVESLSFLAALNREGFIDLGAFTADKKLEDFTSGRTAFIIAPSKDVEFIRERMGDEAFGVTTVPAPDNYAGKTFLGSAGWTAGVYSRSPLKEEARIFADFLAAKASALSEKINAIPEDGAAPTPDPFHSKIRDIAISGETAREFSGLPWTELEAIFRDELLRLFTDTSTPAGTAAAIQERWKTVIQ